jgi:hypothetical protein
MGRAALAQAVAGDIVRDREVLAGEVVQVLALQRFARRETHRVHEDVETVPVPAQFGEQSVDLCVLGDVARQHDVRAEGVGRLVDAILQPLVLISEGELSAFAMHCVGNAPGDRALAGDADDQGTLAVQESHASSKRLMARLMAQPGDFSRRTASRRPYATVRAGAA